jgi:hypothetical protein
MDPDQIIAQPAALAALEVSASSASGRGDADGGWVERLRELRARQIITDFHEQRANPLSSQTPQIDHPQSIQAM